MYSLWGREPVRFIYLFPHLSAAALNDRHDGGDNGSSSAIEELPRVTETEPRRESFQQVSSSATNRESEKEKISGRQRLEVCDYIASRRSNGDTAINRLESFCGKTTCESGLVGNFQVPV